MRRNSDICVLTVVNSEHKGAEQCHDVAINIVDGVAERSGARVTTHTAAITNRWTEHDNIGQMMILLLGSRQCQQN